MQLTWVLKPYWWSLGAGCGRHEGEISWNIFLHHCPSIQRICILYGESDRVWWGWLGIMNPVFMMRWWLGNTFCITGLLWWETNNHWWFLLTAGQWCWALMFTLILAWTNYCVEQTIWVVCDLRGHNTHINGLMQERRNSIADALELRLSCTKSSKWLHCNVQAWGLNGACMHPGKILGRHFLH